MRRLFDFLRTDDLPLMSRPNYVAEVRQIALWGVLAGTVEGSMASVVVSKTFAASELLTTIVWQLPVLMYVLNVVWGSVLRGRRRKPAFLLIASGGVLCVATLTLAPDQWRPWGGWVFAAQIACTHLFVSGLITLRTTMWRANYPETHRARIAGRLQTVRVLLGMLTSAALGQLYNADPGWYRFVYPTAAAVGAASLIFVSRMRMRGERFERRQYRVRASASGTADDHFGLGSGLREIVTILRTDRAFARFMWAQFVLGAANFFTDPILVNALTKDLDFDYFSSLALLDLIPLAFMLISMQIWAPIFDRVAVLRFRVINTVFWTASYAGAAAGMLIISAGGIGALLWAMPVLILARICKGIGWGGGHIAWNIGHMYFARAHQTELYMSIHVGLTGLRALIMPHLGMWSRQSLGYSALLISVALGLMAHQLFRRLTDEADRVATRG